LSPPPKREFLSSAASIMKMSNAIAMKPTRIHERCLIFPITAINKIIYIFKWAKIGLFFEIQKLRNFETEGNKADLMEKCFF
jgi:hypothetical protein